MQTKFRTSCKKIPADDQEKSWQHRKHAKLLTKKLHPDEETNFDVQEFDDSDEDFISKQHEVQVSQLFYEVINEVKSLHAQSLVDWAFLNFKAGII